MSKSLANPVVPVPSDDTKLTGKVQYNPPTSVGAPVISQFCELTLFVLSCITNDSVTVRSAKNTLMSTPLSAKLLTLICVELVCVALFQRM